MSEFSYLIKKVMASEFKKDPFQFIYIEDFFTNEHFKRITQCKQINLPKFKSTEELCSSLVDEYQYKPQPFPGCTTRVNDYIKWYNTQEIGKGVGGQDLLEGYGMAFRLREYNDPILESSVNFFKSDDWHNCLKEKFSKTRETIVDTGIQKYVSGYEISPHPDIRKKCATWMININTSNKAEKIGLHTHLMKFRKDKEWIYQEWKTKTNINTCWVPWDWAETSFLHTKNNSVVLFAPSYDTLHAIKLKYDHTKLQRTQFYGNLWYTDEREKYDAHANWKKFNV